MHGFVVVSAISRVPCTFSFQAPPSRRKSCSFPWKNCKSKPARLTSVFMDGAPARLETPAYTCPAQPPTGITRVCGLRDLSFMWKLCFQVGFTFIAIRLWETKMGRGLHEASNVKKTFMFSQGHAPPHPQKLNVGGCHFARARVRQTGSKNGTDLLANIAQRWGAGGTLLLACELFRTS